MNNDVKLFFKNMQNTDKNSTIIVIPARMASTRLPNKPLADINGKPMIVHVFNNAKKADIGRVIVATDNEEIAKIIKNNGGEAFMTPSNLSSGTLRVGNALAQITEKYAFVINLQGDMPNIQPDVIHLIKDGLIEYKNADIMTAVYELDKSNSDIKKTNVVKAVLCKNEQFNAHKTLYFSRSVVPFNASVYYAHIGIYGFRYDALQKFLSLPESQLEQFESLEQLKALEHGMSIYSCISKYLPVSVDVPEDLENARKIMAWS